MADIPSMTALTLDMDAVEVVRYLKVTVGVGDTPLLSVIKATLRRHHQVDPSTEAVAYWLASIVDALKLTTMQSLLGMSAPDQQWKYGFQSMNDSEHEVYWGNWARIFCMLLAITEIDRLPGFREKVDFIP